VNLRLRRFGRETTVTTPFRKPIAAAFAAFVLCALPLAARAQIFFDPCILVGGTLTVDSSLGNSPYTLASGSMAWGCEIVGNTGTGVFNQSGGTNTVSRSLTLGSQAGSFGQYILTGGTLSVGSVVTGAGQSFLSVSGGVLGYTSVAVNSLWVGSGAVGVLNAGTGQSVSVASLVVGNNGGNGSFTINSGANVSATNLSVASTVGSQGTVTLNAGALATGNAVVGGSGTGTLNQLGGAHTVSGTLTLGAFGSGNGTYNLSGGTLSAASEVISGSSTGTFNQSGGTHTVSGDLQLGNLSGFLGSYNLTGGTLQVGTISRGSGTSLVNVSGGTLDFGSSISVGLLWVGASAPGSFAVGAGQSVVADGVNVGVNGGNGAFTIASGASVSASNFSVGYTTGSQGKVTMNGGTLTTSSSEVATSGTGTFDQNAGTHAVSGALQLGAGGNGNGTYNLAGGTLTDASVVVGNYAPGTFNQTGGAHTTSGDLAFGGFAGMNGTYTLQAGSLGVGGNITTGPGTGTLKLDGGTLTMAPNHSISVTTLALGSTLGTNGVYTHSSGSVSANRMVVGQQGNGSFTQAGGSAAVATDLMLASAGATSGTYTLQGGTLAVTGAITTGAGNGVLNLDGGSLSVGNGIAVTMLNLGSDAVHSGSFALVAGNVAATNLDVGLNGGGDFEQSGGSVTATNVAIAANPGSTGSYALTGGTLGAGSLVNNGLLTYSGGSLTLSGAFTNNGIYQQAGTVLTLTAAAAHSNVGSMALDATSQLRVLGALTNKGTMTLAGAQVSGTAQLTNDSTGVIQGPGSISGPFANAGVLMPGGAGTTRVAQAFTNSGAIQLNAAASTLLGGTIDNTGTIQGLGTVGNAIANGGTVEAIGGTLTLSGAVGNGAAGLMASGTGTKLLVSGGLAINQGTINLAGGTFDNNNHALTNHGEISGFGILRTGGLTNQASVTLASGVSTVGGSVLNDGGAHFEVAYGSALFTGPVTNQGTFKTTGATVSFAGGFNNSGAYVSDPATQSFTDLVVAANGYLTGGAGDVFNVSHSFVNQSTQNTLWNTRGATLVFNGSGSEAMLLAGLDKGAQYAGYQDNFAWGNVELASGAGLTISSGASGKGALYVGVFTLGAGLGQLGSIVSDANIYYDPALAGNSYLAGRTYALAGSGLLAPVPEPATWALLLTGLGVVGATRRRVGRGG
jgi:hypothetical protein